MFQKYEYKFIRLGKGLFWAKSRAEKEYKDIIDEHTNKGWRLVQIFAPSTGFYGMSRYYEIILEKEKF